MHLRLSVSAMGTTFSIALHGRDRDSMETAVGAAFDEVRRLDRLLSNYRSESEWSVVNRTAGREPVPLSPELFHLISRCLDASVRTDGAFDITVGPLKRAWGFYRGTGSVPSTGALDAARQHVGFRFVHLEPSTQTIQFDHPGVELDPGGLGKGYAVDQMVDVLRQHGVESAMVAGSKSSIYGLGTPPTGADGWRADISVPERPGTCLGQVFLHDTSLSTSGTGEQCCWLDGAMYSHIVDPRTGWPLQQAAQVSVVTPSALDGEVWAKACLINGPTWTAAHKPDDLRVVFCDGSAGSPATWL